MISVPALTLSRSADATSAAVSSGVRPAKSGTCWTSSTSSTASGLCWLEGAIGGPIDGPIDGRGTGKDLVNEGHCHGALAHRGGDALGRGAPHVAGNQDARHAGFEPVGLARQRPAAHALAAVAFEVGTREDVALRIELYCAAEP